MTMTSRACLLGATLLLGCAAASQGTAADPVAPKSYAQCQGCHAYKKGAAHGIGPNLYGILGRKVGSAKGYAYSSAARKASFAWTEKRLGALIANPKGYKKTLPKAAHGWRANAAEALKRELIPFFRAISPGAASK